MLGVLLVAAVVLNVAARLTTDGGSDTVDTADPEVTVTEALGAPDGVTRTVRGYVFEDAIGLRLCNARQRDPVRCIGPFVELRGFDPASVPLERDERDGQTVVYSRDAVSLVGTLEILTLTVADIAR